MTEPDELWDPKLRAFVPRPSALWALLVGLVIGAIVGALLTVSVVHATPRPVSLPAGQLEAPSSGLHVLYPSQRAKDDGASPSPTTPVRTASSAPLTSYSSGRTGILAYADESLGASYLAIPIGPGHLVTVCGPAACWTTVSTDAGPNHERLVAGRIADVAVRQWERICGLDRIRGTCNGSWTLGGPGVTPPPTDVTP